MNTKYYLIEGFLIGKTEDGINYLLRNGNWVLDSDHVISDYLIGYDPSEPAGSPFRCYNPAIMDAIEEISEEDVAIIIEKQKKK